MNTVFDDNAPDKQLFLAVVSNNRLAFEILFKRYYLQLCKYVHALLGSASESEDIVQDIYIYIWNNRTSIVLEKEFKNYIFSMAKHAALNLLKHKCVELKNHPMLIEYIENISSNDFDIDEEVRIKMVHSAIEKLPEQCKLIFKMSCLDCMTYKEIAENLDISVNTVKTHIRRAYSIVRSIIKDSSDILPILFFYLLFSNEKDS